MGPSVPEDFPFVTRPERCRYHSTDETDRGVTKPSPMPFGTAVSLIWTVPIRSNIGRHSAIPRRR